MAKDREECPCCHTFIPVPKHYESLNVICPACSNRLSWTVPLFKQSTTGFVLVTKVEK
jgi:hypothetical protein